MNSIKPKPKHFTRKRGYVPPTPPRRHVPQRPASWIGVDLDGTLARYDKWRGVEHIGDPVWPMVERVKGWLAAGQAVKIVTARVACRNSDEVAVARFYIDEWCRMHLGGTLEIVSGKDMHMTELWDDRAVQVRVNTGRPVTEEHMDANVIEALLKPLFARYEEISKIYDEFEALTRCAPESKLAGAIFVTHDLWRKELAVRLRDTSGWLDWFIYDNELGAKGLPAKAAAWEKPRRIKTVRDLAAVLAADYY